MQSFTLKKEVIKIEEREIIIPRISHFIETDHVTELCDIMGTKSMECIHADCEQCVFSEDNFDIFMEMMNEKIVQKQSDETRKETDS